MDNIKQKLQQLLAAKHEDEVLEFKTATEKYDFDKLGQYVSALANEANLKNQPDAWLIFGVKNNKTVEGTRFKESGGLHQLKDEVATHTTNHITFKEIYEVCYQSCRVIMFQIPAAPRGLPIAWYGHYYGRNGEALSPLNIEEIERIRGQSADTDWSARICCEASINDLDANAIRVARNNFKNKFPQLAAEIDKWDDITFLNKAKITIDGKITNTALLLLGKDEAQHFIRPAVAQITWILKDKNNIALDYQHFYMPFIISAEQAAQKIRNLTYRYLPDNTLFPTEVTQYAPYVIREALHNCIAHQDYNLQQRINLVEFPEHLIFENGGTFIPGTIDKVIEQDRPQMFYRNKFLCEAMVRLDMIDTIGSGIKRMFEQQRERYFPLPDYTFEIKEGAAVKVIIFGRIIDKNYTQLLISEPDLPLEIVIALDKAQKGQGQAIDINAAIRLKAMRLLEGRRPNYFVASRIAHVAKEKASYIKNKAFDNVHYKNMILAFIDKFGSATRNELDELLMEKLSDVLTSMQKKNKIKNLLSSLKRSGLVRNVGSDKLPKWEKVTVEDPVN